jgi:hypothetical protein
MSTVDERIRQDQTHRHVQADDHTVVELIKQLRDEGTTLFRQEILLAKQEMSEKVSRVGRNVGYLVAGGLVAYAGVVVVLLALSALVYTGLVAAGLSHFISGWLAPLIVGGVVALIGFGLVKKAQHALADETAVPERTKQSLQEDKQWIQNKVTS